MYCTRVHTRRRTTRMRPALLLPASLAVVVATCLPSRCQVAIVGGGLGGLSACVALRRRGIDAHVFEAAPKLLRGSTGTGIMVSANGWSALEAIDPSLPTKIRERGARIVRQSVRACAPNGAELRSAAMNATSFLDRYGAEQYNVGWARAHEVLASLVPKGAIHCGCKLETYCTTASGDGVEVEFEDGRCVRALLLIGADGAGSAVRRLVAGEHACHTKYNGQLLWNAILPSDCVPRAHGKGEVEFITCGVDGQAILAFDAGEGQTSWYLTLKEEYAAAETKARLAEGGDKFGGFGRPGVRDELRQVFAAWPLALELLSATPEDKVFERRIADRAKLMRWQDASARGGGRVVLMGDAAHPMVPSQGQGTMVTWEDAAELATCILGLAGDDLSRVPAAVDVFVARRAKRCAMVQKFSRQAYMGRPSPQFFPLKMLRMLRTKGKIDRIYGYKI